MISDIINWFVSTWTQLPSGPTVLSLVTSRSLYRGTNVKTTDHKKELDSCTHTIEFMAEYNIQYHIPLITVYINTTDKGRNVNEEERPDWTFISQRSVFLRIQRRGPGWRGIAIYFKNILHEFWSILMIKLNEIILKIPLPPPNSKNWAFVP